jgi:hypothetical protein
MRRFSEDNRFPDRDAVLAPTEYKYKTLPLDHPVRQSDLSFIH